MQLNLARVHARLEFLRLINWKVAWDATAGRASTSADASTIKVFGTEFYLEAFRLLMEVLGQRAYLRAGVARRRARSRASSAATAASSSSPSAAASTRCSAT